MNALRRTLAPTLALAAMSAAVAVGFTRLIAGDDWIPAVVGAAVLPHLVGWCTRNRTAVLQVALWLGGLVGYVVATVVASGVPIGRSPEAVADRLEAGLRILRDQTVPVPDRPGVVLLAVIVVWCMAAAADVLAFRRWASVGALAPGVTVFIWIAALAPDAGRPARAAAAVAVTAAAFVALQHQVLQTRRRTAVGSDQAVPAPRSVLTGVGIAVVAAVVAAALAPSLPGAGADPMVDLRDDDLGSSAYQTEIPPLVGVADDLKRGQRVELFTVAADAPQYWRTVALDEYSSFAGGQWTLKADGGDIDRGLDDDVPAGAIRQQYAIGPMGERWMPAAFDPLSVNRPDTLVVADSRTLVTGADSVTGLTYTVYSAPPSDRATPAQQQATGAVPGDLVQFTDLPADVPAEVGDLAREITAGAASPYEQATRLRDYFRDGSFTYDATIDLSDSADATLVFLQVKRGFCVQFASTYALMARSLGIPARVAVGFTPGVPDATTGRYVVSNFEAHAWPEVWLPEIGWTNRFEPTPPSPAPGGSDLPGDTTGAEVTPPVTAPPPTTILPVPGSADPVPPVTGAGDPIPSGTTADDGGGGIPTWVVALVVLVVLGAVAVAAAPVAKVRRRSLRRRRADPAERVAGAWAEAVDRLRELGTPPPVTVTPAEFAAGADTLVGPDAAGALAVLADAHTDAQFRGGPVTDAEADTAWADLDDFTAALHAHLDARTRLRARVLPLPREHTRV